MSTTQNGASDESHGIGEPSFADALAAICAADGLNETHRRHWSTSLRQMAGYLERPIATLSARITAIRPGVMKLHPEQLGVNAKTFANHRANVLAALNWFWSHGTREKQQVRLTPPYAALWSQIEGQRERDILSPLLRFLSATGVPLDAISDAHIDAFITHRRETSFARVTASLHRQLVRRWNACVGEIEGWPQCVLTEPAYASCHTGPAWDDFPQTLRQDIDAYCVELTRPRKTLYGRRMKACQGSTIETRRRELIALVRTAVEIGMPLETLTNFDALLHPDVVEQVLDHYWSKNGDNPSLYTIDLAARLFNLARTATKLGEVELERLDEMRLNLEQYRSSGLTEKNRTLVRQVTGSDVWQKVVHLPRRMMAEARADRVRKPVKVAVLAQLAVAIRILTVAPIRLQNLTAIELGINLVRPSGPDTPYRLVFPDYDVKNRVPLEFPFDEETTALIDAYVHDFRPSLMRGRNHDRLFPGDGADGKDKKTFGSQISERLWKLLGLRITPHQFRHAAAAIMLAQEPGNYELVRRVLGHRNIQTTINFYVGLETLAATQAYGGMVTELAERRGTATKPQRRNRKLCNA